ncbi:efflux RND transporter periplasmic adaptor subunit [Castellaniella hirudinis]|uniref:efflux RND transporter periplasmic adaptor subunit n=1 Tax=Castellaniella hirudinis TaxID=1144617 RepID=UPI0039C188CE
MAVSGDGRADRVARRPWLGWRGAWLMLILMAGAAAVWAAVRPEAPAYEVARVERGPVRATVHALGTLRPRRYVDVGAQVSGQIQHLHVQAGDTVVPGQLLVEIDAAVQQATVAAGRASLDALRAQLDEARAAAVLARADAGRHQRLLRAGATPAQQADAAHASRLAAEAAVRRIQADIRRTRATLQGDEALLGYSRIYAPIAGTVVSLDARPGQTLNAAYQTPTLLRIADLSTMTVWTQVSEADIPHLRVGMATVFTTLAQDGRQWRGTVRQVLPMPQAEAAESPDAGGAQAAGGAKAVFYTVLFDVANVDRALLPRMSAQVAFVTRHVEDAVLVPLVALQPAADDAGAGLESDAEAGRTYRVRVLEDGRAVQRVIRIGARDRRAAEVLDGLAEGEHLILGDPAPEGGMPRFVL